MKRVLFLLLLTISTIAYANVYVDEISIETEFYGVLNKTRAEFILRNDSEWDNRQGFIHLYINKTAIVTDMWLEIDGRLERAETLARQTGEQIYDRITRRNIDPAVLTKSGNGIYELRVFPVNAHSSRRVVIEYVCIVESSGKSFDFVWLFNAEAKTKTIDVIKKYPSDIDICASSVLKEDVETSGDFFRVKDNRKFGLILDVPFSEFAFYNNKSYMVLKNHEIVVNPKYYNCYNAVQLETLIWDIDHFPKYLVKYVYGGNPFIQSFLEYLERKKLIELEYHQEAPGWLQRDKMWTYYDPAFTLTLQPLARNAIDEYYCPFLDVYQDYLAILKTTLAEQKDKGFLVERLSKLVIEDDRRAQRIRRQELENEDWESLEESIEPAPDEYEQKPSDNMDNDGVSAEAFIAYDEPPSPIGGFSAIHKKLNFPRFLLYRYEGKVIVTCLIGEDGKVLETRILKSLHPLLDQAAIDAIRATEWKPAKQRIKPVKVWISIPLVFRQGGKKDVIELSDSFVFKDREFYCESDEKYICCESGFNEKQCIGFAAGTEDFFKYLIENPDIIAFVDLIYNNTREWQLGLVVEGQSVMFVKE